MESFQRARRGRQDLPYKPLAVRTLAEQQAELPGWRLDHLVRMTDSAGMLQHATSTIPNFAEGYCTDDNARALLLTVLLEQLGQDGPEVQRAGDDLRGVPPGRLRPRAGAVPQLPGLRPPLARGGRLGRLPRPGALGAGGLRRPVAAARPAVLGRAALRPGPAGDPRDDLAAGLGLRPARRPRVPPPVRRRPAAGQMRDALTERLIELYERTATPDWPWFEEVLTYDNAKLPHALIASGRDGGDPRALEIGLQALGWLVEVQQRPAGLLPADRLQRLLPQGGRAGPVRPAADRGPRDGRRLPRGLPRHRGPRLAAGGPLAFEWFLGGNDLGPDLYDPGTGGCCDGLQEDRVNLNQGAESTLAFLLSLGEMKLLESTLATFRQVR